MVGVVFDEIDVALSLIHRIPQLPLTHESGGLRPLYALARMPSAFPSGSGFGRLQQLIYNGKHSISLFSDNMFEVSNY